jgi:hypothetical protein
MPDLRGAGRVLAALALAAAGAPALAVPIVTYTVDDLGGGLYQYNLQVANDGGGEALSGLNVRHGDTVFGLDSGSAIGSPGGWDAPLPSLVDDLAYFSLDESTDIAIGGTLAGFTFQSTTAPGSLGSDDLRVEGIGAGTATQIDLGVAQLVPEPASGLLLAAALAGLGALRRSAEGPRRR